MNRNQYGALRCGCLYPDSAPVVGCYPRSPGGTRCPLKLAWLAVVTLRKLFADFWFLGCSCPGCSCTEYQNVASFICCLCTICSCPGCTPQRQPAAAKRQPNNLDPRLWHDMESTSWLALDAGGGADQESTDNFASRSGTALLHPHTATPVLLLARIPAARPTGRVPVTSVVRGRAVRQAHRRAVLGQPEPNPCGARGCPRRGAGGPCGSGRSAATRPESNPDPRPSPLPSPYPSP